jgi:hypothetical protein
MHPGQVRWLLPPVAPTANDGGTVPFRGAGRGHACGGRGIFFRENRDHRGYGMGEWFWIWPRAFALFLLLISQNSSFVLDLSVPLHMHTSILYLLLSEPLRESNNEEYVLSTHILIDSRSSF